MNPKAPFGDRCPMCSAEPVARDPGGFPFVVEIVEHSFDCPWVAANADRIGTQHAAMAVLTELMERAR